MFVVREVAPGEFVEMQAAPAVTGPDDANYPWQIVELWADDELEALSIFRVEATDTPEGKRLVSYTFARGPNGVTYVPTFEDIQVPPEPPIILAVTPRQMRLALSAFGLRQAVEDYVNAQAIEVQDNWQYASVFLRDNPIILAGQQVLQLSDAQIDSLFELALTL